MPGLIKGKHLGPLMMLPCKPDVCQECAVKHEPEMTHDNRSMYYQYKFFNEHGRWPTWDDAMAHCTEEMKQATMITLRELKIVK